LVSKKAGILIGLLGLGLLIGSVSAFQNGLLGGNGFAMDDAVQSALANNDYEAFVEAHAAMQESRRQISEEQFGTMSENYALNQEIESAIEAGNYSAWKTLVEQSDSPMAEQMLSQISEENFSLLKELKQTQERSREIMSELDLERGMNGAFPGHPNQGRGMRMGRGMGFAQGLNE